MSSNLDEALKKVTDIIIKNVKERVRKEFISDMEPKVERLPIEEKSKKIMMKGLIDALDLGLSITDYLQEQEEFSIMIEKY